MSGRIYRPTYTVETESGEREQRQSSVWWLDFTVNGERRRMSAETRDRDEAERLLHKKLYERGQRRERPPSRITVKGLGKLLLDDYEKHGRKSTPKYSLAHLYDYFGEDRLATTIHRDDVENYVSCRLEDDGAARGTVNRELSALFRALRLARKRGKIMKEEERERVARVLDMGLLKESNARKGFLTREEARKMRSVLPDRLVPLFWAAYTTGWRKSELLSRTWDHVSLDSDPGWLRLESNETKNDDGRNFPLRGQLRRDLEEQKERAEEIERVTGRAVPHVFFYYEEQSNGTLPGAPIKSFRRAWDSARDAIDRPGLLWHDLRRSAARNMIRAGVSERATLDLCGWNSRAMLKRYAIMDEKALSHEGEKLDRFLEEDEPAESTAKK